MWPAFVGTVLEEGLAMGYQCLVLFHGLPLNCTSSSMPLFVGIVFEDSFDMVDHGLPVNGTSQCEGVRGHGVHMLVNGMSSNTVPAL